MQTHHGCSSSSGTPAAVAAAAAAAVAADPMPSQPNRPSAATQQAASPIGLLQPAPQPQVAESAVQTLQAVEGAIHPNALVFCSKLVHRVHLPRHHVNKCCPTEALNATTLDNNADYAPTGSGSVPGEPVQVRQPHLRLVPYSSLDFSSAGQHMQAAGLAFPAVC